jgi:hypothetical protein
MKNSITPPEDFMLRRCPPLFKMQLSWAPVAGAVKYNIYARTGDDPECSPNEVRFGLIDSTPNTVFVYLSSSGLSASGQFGFYVTAVDVNGNESPPSEKKFLLIAKMKGPMNDHS